MKANRKEGKKIRLYNDGAKDGVYTTGPRSLHSSLLPLDLATAKDFIRCLAKNNVFTLCGRISCYLGCPLVVSLD